MNDWRVTVCVASGPSLTVAQCAIAAEAQRRGACRIIVVNDNYRRIPSADALYAADRSWWKLHIGALQAAFRGEYWTVDDRAAEIYGLRRIASTTGAGLHPRGIGKIPLGSNGGFQAICLARELGAKRIVLIGYDMQRTGGKDHWFGKHPAPLANGNPSGFVKFYDLLAPQLRAEGTEVINCTIETALKCFPRADLAETLQYAATLA